MITIDIDDDAILSALDRVARAVTDLQPVLQDIGETMVETTRERFMTGVSPDGVAWAPKSEATLARYRRLPGKTDTRPLWGPSGDLHTLFAAQASATEVSWGTNVIYSAVMQFGATKGEFGENAAGYPIPWGDIPARPFLGVSDEDRNSIISALNDWLMQAWGSE
ncbi:phage virion morphogenesis protein [Pararhodobacter zhoushanensis]|uniref:Phage virion morphogenesis protein n=1 Tax=Pararhodobacter zhoushanensis TaxID=2479545 RepID=A0ABT3H2X5_9RHOB|nr:phage virion morphogenesis protein [Pararhodobacter zhoushanensis]MCW1934113.1 phage virion morphogenesis protein [Pararhodobacter zhoushanensis]